MFCAFLLFGALAEAQSGRRVPKQPNTPPPSQTPASKEPDDSEPPPPEPVNTEPQKPLAVLIVTLDSRNFSNGSSASNYIFGSFVNRLKQSPSVEVRVEKEMNRKQAIDQAKLQTDAHIVWIEIDADESSINQGQLRRIEAGYTVFAPNTAKVKTQGHIPYRPYQPTVGVGQVNIPSPVPLPSGRSTMQYSLQQMGYDMADRIMDSFGIIKPARRP